MEFVPDPPSIVPVNIPELFTKPNVSFPADPIRLENPENAPIEIPLVPEILPEL